MTTSNSEPPIEGATAATPGAAESQVVPTFVFWPTRLSRSLRFKLFFSGVICPAICWTAIVVGRMTPNMDSPWQSGHWSDYLGVLLMMPTILVFLPLVIYSMVCLSVWCWHPRLSRYAWLRTGIYGGIVLAIMFMAMLLEPTLLFSQFFALIVMTVLAAIVWMVPWMVERAKRFTILQLLLLTTLVAAAMVVLPLVNWPVVVFEMLGSGALMVVGAAPSTAFVAFVRASVAASFLAGHHAPAAPKRNLVLAGIVWILALAGTWKLAIEMMLVEYNKLPTTNPNCFVSGAAAGGHRRFVGARRQRGQPPVNLQMQRLKFLEFALATGWPVAHRVVRSLYNRWGPLLARGCGVNRWIADVTFVLLKPVEWVALTIQQLLGVESSMIESLYRRR